MVNSTEEFMYRASIVFATKIFIDIVPNNTLLRARAHDKTNAIISCFKLLILAKFNETYIILTYI